MWDEICCPECKAGKHRNCDGNAWDAERDAQVDCPCDQLGHVAEPLAEESDADVGIPVVVHPETGEAQSLADWVGQAKERSDEEAAYPVAALALDAWHALGADPLAFEDYVERNGLAATWGMLMQQVRIVRGQRVCGRPVDGDVSDPCVLLEHSPDHPCYGRDDVGRDEPLPMPPPRVHELERHAYRLAVAIEHTVEYVGNDVLPAIEGWSWFDALKAFAPELAQRFIDSPVLPNDVQKVFRMRRRGMGWSIEYDGREISSDVLHWQVEPSDGQAYRPAQVVLTLHADAVDIDQSVLGRPHLDDESRHTPTDPTSPGGLSEHLAERPTAEDDLDESDE